MPPGPAYVDYIRDWPHDGDASYLESQPSSRFIVKVDPLSIVRSVIEGARTCYIARYQTTTSTPTLWIYNGSSYLQRAGAALTTSYAAIAEAWVHGELAGWNWAELRCGLSSLSGTARCTQGHIEVFMSGDIIEPTTGPTDAQKSCPPPAVVAAMQGK